MNSILNFQKCELFKLFEYIEFSTSAGERLTGVIKHKLLGNKFCYIENSYGDWLWMISKWQLDQTDRYLTSSVSYKKMFYCHQLNSETMSS